MQKGYNPRNGILFLNLLDYEVSPILFDSFKDIFYETRKRNNFKFTDLQEFFYNSIRTYITLHIGEDGYKTPEGEEILCNMIEDASKRMYKAGFIEMVRKGLTLDEILKRKIN